MTRDDAIPHRHIRFCCSINFEPQSLSVFAASITRSEHGFYARIPARCLCPCKEFNMCLVARVLPQPKTHISSFAAARTQSSYNI